MCVRPRLVRRARGRQVHAPRSRACPQRGAVPLRGRADIGDGQKITVSCGTGLGDTEVTLSPVRENVTAGPAAYLTPGMPVSFDSVPGEWYRIGVSVPNPTDTGIAVFVKAEGVNVRVE